PVCHVQVLAEISEDYRAAGVLADRVPLLAGDAGVLEQPVEDRAADLGFLDRAGALQGGQHVRAHPMVDRDAEVADRPSDGGGIERPHRCTTWSLPRLAPPRGSG